MSTYEKYFNYHNTYDENGFFERVGGDPYRGDIITVPDDL